MFTFTAEQLRQLLSDAITDFAGKGAMDYIEQYRQDRAAAVERIMAQLEANPPQRDTLLENSLPYWEKEGEFEAHLKWLAENNPEWLKKAFDASNIPNSLPAIDEDEDPDWWVEDSQATEHLRLILFDGQPISYESDDDSPAGLGLPPMA